MIAFIIGVALGACGVALLASTALRQQDRTIQLLRRVYQAAASLSEELVLDPIKRDVTWFYDGASAWKKVLALHVALEMAFERRAAS